MTTHFALAQFDLPILRAVPFGRRLGGSRLGIQQWFGHRRDISHGGLVDIVATSCRGGLGMMPRTHALIVGAPMQMFESDTGAREAGISYAGVAVRTTIEAAANR